MSQSKRRSAIVIASLIIAGTATAVGVGIGAQSPNQAIAAPPTDIPSSIEAGDLTASNIAIAAATGTKLSVETPVSLLNQADSAQRVKAIAVAGNSLTMLRGHVIRAASLMKVTVEGYGVPAAGEGDKTDPSRLDLFVDNRELWVVQVADVDVPIFGTGKDANREQPVSTDRADVLVLVDPATMKIVEVESLSADTPEPPGVQKR